MVIFYFIIFIEMSLKDGHIYVVGFLTLFFFSLLKGGSGFDWFENNDLCKGPHAKTSVITWSSDPAIPLPGMAPNKLKARTRTAVTHGHSSTVHPNQKAKDRSCPPATERIDNTRSIPTMEYYPALKRNKILTCYNVEEVRDTC